MPSDNPLHRFVERHCTAGLNSMLHHDLGQTAAKTSRIDNFPLSRSSTRSESPSPRVGERRPRSQTPAVYERKAPDAKRARIDSPSPPRRGQIPSVQVQSAVPPLVQQADPSSQQRFSPAPVAMPPLPPTSETATNPSKASYNPAMRRSGAQQQHVSLQQQHTVTNTTHSPAPVGPPPSVADVMPEGIRYLLNILPNLQSYNGLFISDLYIMISLTKRQTGPVLPGPTLVDLMSRVALPALPVAPQGSIYGGGYDRRGSYGTYPAYR